MTSERDRLFRDPDRQLVDFAFDASVVAVFPDMIRRSVPGYETVIPMTGLLAARHVQALGRPGRRIYDLGCSLGATALAVCRQLDGFDTPVVGVDSAPAMIAAARRAVTDPRIRFVEADVRDCTLDEAGVVILNYVLQFIPPADRRALLARIKAALGDDGLLIVSGKLGFEDPAEQAFFEAAHLDFKRANGYSELEISGKRSALERVMTVDTEARHRELFATAGFALTRKWYQCLNWASFLAWPRAPR